MNLPESIYCIIEEALNCSRSEIEVTDTLKSGMTNQSFIFSRNGKQYIFRQPGAGTDKLISRQQEFAVYQIIGSENISDNIVYFNPLSGYKITEYISEARCCDPYNEKEVQVCMQFLKAFHRKKLEVDHVFDLKEKIEFYESLWTTKHSKYRDYGETKQKVYKLLEYIEKQPKKWTLCHIDSVPDNFMLTKDKVYLIDWEYAGMQDAYVDIAMFAIYAMYDKANVDKLIDCYFEEECPADIRKRIYAYIAVCGFLWSNWCEYKEQVGQEFGEYAIRQYRYAGEYYDYAEQL